MLTQQSFEAVTRMFQEVSGIHLNHTKRALVTGRLQKLAQARGLMDVNHFVDQLLDERDPQELVQVVDRLTTNETYFFREPQHFDRLAELVAARPPGAGEFRVWSAASSSGEEAYSIAMVLAERLGLRGWEVVGTDLSSTVVADARRALYPLERARHVPDALLRRWCLKGREAYEGQLLIHRDLRRKVRFECANLMQSLPELGTFDLIFLRNVLIYFDADAKAAIVRRVLSLLKPGGLLFTGHAESILQLGLPVKAVAPAVYGHA